jgi:pimeloyl-ACP methyl ester carboxylesterase
LHPGLFLQHHGVGLDHQHRGGLVLKAADLRGAARLATEATAGLADVVEAMHERIARLPGFKNKGVPGKTTGITGLVYRSVRGVTRLVGGSVDALLTLLTPLLRDEALSSDREATVAALNGVLGDHLLASHNPLAIAMRLRVQGLPLVLNRAALQTRIADTKQPILILIHGLCMNDLQWQRDGHDHGAALAKACGFTPLYLHYNSGLATSDNGAALSRLLQDLCNAWPQDKPRVALLGHSMGGLVARSALHQASVSGHAWPQQTTDLICLGTPHHGAPLERAGHGVDLLLGATPYSAPLRRLSQLRSAGITDLRHGRLMPDTNSGQLQHLPLPTHMRCYALAGTTGQTAGDVKDRLLGDGLVPLRSALGQHKTAAGTLRFAPENQWVAAGVNHMQLLSSPEVFKQLQAWLT